MRVAMSLGRRDLAGEAEAVEQLRAQLPLLRVAGADEHELRRMAQAQALALDGVDARGRHVEQEIHQVVLQQVDLVDVEEAAVGLGQQPRLERLDPGAERPLQVEGADHPVLGRPERQIHHRHWFLLGFSRSA